MKFQRVLIALGAVALLGSVNYSIYKKESIKQTGEVVFLELLPVDPRSLMQGDYMALRFALAAQLNSRIPNRYDATNPAGWSEGKFEKAFVTLDSRRVATLAVRNEGLSFRYRIRHGQAWLGTNAFFFEEGTAERYSGARFGEFRVDPSTGEALLVGLRDPELRPL